MSGWTDELIEQLKVLYAEGFSFGVIARVLGNGLSRNAVIGKAHRIGLRDRHNPSKPRTQRRALPLSVAMPSPPQPQPKPEPEPEKPVPGVTIANIAHDQCRFPLWPHDGEVGDGPMCGNKVVRGAYCRKHADLCMPLSQHPRSRDAKQAAENEFNLSTGSKRVFG